MKSELIMATILYVGLALIGGAVGWAVNGWRLSSQVEKAKAEYSESKAAAYQEVINQIAADTKRMADAAEGNTVKTAQIDKDINAIMKELKNAKPLPVECRLDDFRMRNLTAAVADLQRTLAGSKPSSTVRDTGATK